jgi:hypothetical protein
LSCRPPCTRCYRTPTENRCPLPGTAVVPSSPRSLPMNTNWNWNYNCVPWNRQIKYATFTLISIMGKNIEAWRLKTSQEKELQHREKKVTEKWISEKDPRLKYEKYSANHEIFKRIMEAFQWFHAN